MKIVMDEEEDEPRDSRDAAGCLRTGGGGGSRCADVRFRGGEQLANVPIFKHSTEVCMDMMINPRTWISPIW